jgi:hypothetical protein
MEYYAYLFLMNYSGFSFQMELFIFVKTLIIAITYSKIQNQFLGINFTSGNNRYTKMDMMNAAHSSFNRGLVSPTLFPTTMSYMYPPQLQPIRAIPPPVSSCSTNPPNKICLARREAEETGRREEQSLTVHWKPSIVGETFYSVLKYHKS